ncbi:hypothetical protein AAMO2058_001381300 [Amorphochlora amoebiformis]
MASPLTLFVYAFMICEAALVLILLAPISFLNRMTVKLCKAVIGSSEYVYFFFVMVGLLLAVNGYAAYSSFVTMRDQKREGGPLSNSGQFYRAQRDIYLNIAPLYLWIVLVGLISLHERNERLLAAARRAEEEKKNQ